MHPKINNENTGESFIDLQVILRILIRNKIYISALTFAATLLTILFSLKQTPVYRGNFQILVNNVNTSNNSNLGSGDNSDMINLFLSGLGTSSNDNKTQEYILRSPSVLKPVFNLAIQKYAERGEDTSKLFYETWVENSLKIEFELGTQVLKISFIDPEKEFIIDILNQISKKYKDYSKQIKEKELIKTLNYLNQQQKSLKEASVSSINKLNSFSLKYGLGNLDGFFTTDIETTNNKDNIGSQEDEQAPSFLNSDAGRRYEKQFAALERYEAELTNYSSKLKPNSQLIKSLKLKIESLKESLKRPNEILLTYRELKKNAFRDESLLNNIEKQLAILKLEIAKQRDAWELISEPTIETRRVAPNRKRNVIAGFLIYLLISSLLSIWKEKKSGKVYELDELLSLLNCNYIDSLYLNNDEINLKITENAFIKENKTQKINKVPKEFNILKFTNENTNLFIKNCRFIDFNDEEIEKNENLILLISPGMITINQIVLINKYNKIYKNKFIGWLYLNEAKNS